MTMITQTELETSFHPDNWTNPRNFDPGKIAEAEDALKRLAEAVRKGKP